MELLGTIRTSSDEPVSITIPIRLQRRGIETKMIIEGPGADNLFLDQNLCRLIALARYLFDQLATGKNTSVRDISKQHNINENEVTRALPLAFLAPTIVEGILAGQQA